MGRSWTSLLPISLSIALSPSAQPEIDQQLSTATQLALQGHFEAAVQQARPLLERMLSLAADRRYG